MNRSKAIEIGERFYHGRICVVTTSCIELAGKRYCSSRHCANYAQHPYTKETQSKINEAYTRSIRWILASAKYRAKRKSLDFNIDEQWIETQFRKQQGRCYWTGVPISLGGENYNTPKRLSPDRLDCSKGYTKDNVVLCCSAMNSARKETDVNEWIKYLQEIGCKPICLEASSPSSAGSP